MRFYRSLLPRRPGANASQCAAIYDDVSQARGSCRLGSNQWCDDWDFTCTVGYTVANARGEDGDGRKRSLTKGSL